MRAVVQRVTAASVTIGGRVHGQIKTGLVVLIGVAPQDSEKDVAYLVKKISRLRVFSDAAGKMNLDLAAVHGAVLAISQFTLFADTRHGNRPGFTDAAEPALGERLYQRFVAALRATGVPVETGVFGADMRVALVNDGPVTICFDTEDSR